MRVEFNVVNLLNKIPVSTELKQYYEKTIQTFVGGISSIIDTSKLTAIIIPNDFVLYVVSFQDQLGMKNPSVTDNEFGRAFGKMLHNKGREEYYVFLDPSLATFLMDDQLFDSCFAALNEDNKQSVILQKKQALNILSHELAHVEFDCKVSRPANGKFYKDGLVSHAYILLDEYFACRKASSIVIDSLMSNDEKYINDLEEKIDNERWSYKTHHQNLNEFVSAFHNYTEMTLIRLVSVIGVRHAQKDDSLPFSNSIVGRFAQTFSNSFDMLFHKLEKNEEIIMPVEVSDAIDQYFVSLGVKISDTDQGLYYYIPD